MRDLTALTRSLAVPGIHVIASDTPARSHFGGSPNLPAGTPWPERNGRPLALVARLSLPELQQSRRIDWLPQIGALLFFYDVEDQAWGFDPNDRGYCAVMHVPDLAAPVASSTLQAADEFMARRIVAFQRIDTLPSAENDAIRDLAFSDDEADAYVELHDAPFRGMPKHQVSGRPSAVQGDSMELECQLVTNGLYCGDPSGYEDPRAKALEPGAKDWRLLLQVDSDDDLGMMWGDMGMLYFFVREQDAKAGRFDNAWMVLQCS
jgi:uncharacterized protein YwqG